MEVLSIKNLTKTYSNGYTAIKDINLTVEAGDIFGFIGHNGAGKTTTLKAVVGALGFEKGQISILGHDISREPIKCKELLAYLPDNPNLYDYLTGIQYLNFIADIFGISTEQREIRIEQLSRRLMLTEYLFDLIGTYSHGTKQKLAIASALVHKPRLLVMDEPFVGLDPGVTFEVKKIMHELCQDGSAIFFSTHVLEVAENLCNKIAIINRGEIKASGVIAEVKRGQRLEEVFLEVTNND